MPLGIGGGKLAADIARAGDEAGANRGGADGQADRFDTRLGRCHICRAHPGDDQVLPDGEADIAVAEIAGDLREPAHLIGGHLADREDDADPIAFWLLLCMRADMRSAIERRSRRQRITADAVKLASEFVLDQRKHLVES